MIPSSYLQIHPEVQAALAQNKPVVALESTIISHGMPWPQNAITAKSVEEEVRQMGAVPATIAIIKGKCIVGLSSDEIDYFGQAKDVWKVSLRDMPYVISQQLPGATTVAATMRIASMVGIKLFATGGIGGVHRGAQDSMDIAAGVKSILDIGLTLEYLETLGIPVVTYLQDEFPSFYSSKSGFQSPLRLDTPHEIAQLIQAKWDLQLAGSVLIANPVPQEFEMDQIAIEKTIQQALAQADLNGVKGKEITPFLLKYIADHTKGESLEANIALIKNNARTAAAVAVALHKL
jgi:pseudouridine-5'-phosphate glycosidase